MNKGITHINLGVGAMIFDGEGRLLLVFREKGARSENSHWRIPGSGIEIHEQRMAGVVRETKEEFSVDIEIVTELQSIDHMIPDEGKHWVLTPFIARIKDEQQPTPPEPEKCAWGWFPLDQLPSPLSAMARLSIQAYERYLGMPPDPHDTNRRGPHIDHVFALLDLTMAQERYFREAAKTGTPALSARSLICIQALDLLAGYQRYMLNPKGLLIPKAVIARAVIEATANIQFIGDNDKRGQKYLDYGQAISERVFEYGRKVERKDITPLPRWTSVSVSDRVRAIHENAYRSYDYLSNFVHGNNIAGHMASGFSYGSTHNLLDDIVCAQIVMLMCLIIPHTPGISTADQDRMLGVIQTIQREEDEAASAEAPSKKRSKRRRKKSVKKKG